jgi:RND family efflux transporter MFP subunit
MRCCSLVSLITLPLIITVTTLCGCRKKSPDYVPPPPPEVTVASPTQRQVPITLEYTGSVRGIETVEIRARVKGFLQKKHIEGGRRVKAGDILFTIDPRSYEAQLAQARAESESQKANLRLTELTLGRLQEAMRSGAGSQQELDRSLAERDAARAQLDLSLARVRAAELDVEFTRVTAPISGRIGIIPVDEGQLIGATEPTLLASVINDDKVLAMYDMDERQVLEIRSKNQNKRPGEDGRPLVEVRLGLANEQGFQHIGQFHKADNRVNPETGTIRIESIFDNPDGTILPGAFVRLLAIYGEKDALLVPDVAILRDASGRYILTLAQDDTVERINVLAGPVFERMRPIEEVVGDSLPGSSPTPSKLNTQTRVIVNGLQRVRPGAKAVAKTAAPASTLAPITPQSR